MKKKTCDKCINYKHASMPDIEGYEFAGSCALMVDSNNQMPCVSIDRAAGWDAESYCAGVYVGPKFGCIHWVGHDRNPAT